MKGKKEPFLLIAIIRRIKVLFIWLNHSKRKMHWVLGSILIDIIVNKNKNHSKQDFNQNKSTIRYSLGMDITIRSPLAQGRGSWLRGILQTLVLVINNEHNHESPDWNEAMNPENETRLWLGTKNNLIMSHDKCAKSSIMIVALK
jgi:hypothetical protein